LAVAALMLILALAGGPLPVFATTAGGGATVQGLYDNLLSAMKNGRTLGQSGRFAALAPVIRRSFDLPLMTRLSVGPSWAALNVPQRQQLIDSFGRYISAIYADRFDSWNGEKLEVTGEEPTTGGVIVRSKIIKSNGEPVRVDYAMHQSGGVWLISDIYLDGTISELATRRSEFAAIIRNQGVDGLIQSLNRKADLLTGTTARAY
jgi:phospholipid transport system substrate-binding protein